MNIPIKHSDLSQIKEAGNHSSIVSGAQKYVSARRASEYLEASEIELGAESEEDDSSRHH